MNTILVLFLSSLFVFAPQVHADTIAEEFQYQKVLSVLTSGGSLIQEPLNKVTVDAIEDYLASADQPLFSEPLLTWLLESNRSSLELADQIRLFAIDLKLTGSSKHHGHLKNVLKTEFQSLDWRTRAILTQQGPLGLLDDKQWNTIKKQKDLAPLLADPPYNEVSPSQLQDLFYKTPDLEKYKGGAYSHAPRLFMFCSHLRNYPCLMLMKNEQDEPVYLEDGKTLWSQPSLGFAHSGKPFHQRNGYTPSGVYEINGVMPAADQKYTFGQFRRLILEFIPKSANESNIQYLIPQNHQDEEWWREGVVARDIGRNLLRIHGTGKKNGDPSSTFFPFMATSGCVAQRENTYDKITYTDQRQLLDVLMAASGMEPTFENEPRIRALLYVIEVKNEKGAVDLRLLNDLGLK